MSCLARSGDSTRCGSARSFARSTARASCRSSSIAEAGEDTRLLRGLELGVNDYLLRPLDQQELTARVRTQVRRKRYTDRLRDSVQSIEMAITDDLTGLHNRRYLDSHLADLVRSRAISRRQPLALLMLDIDHFKSINDSYGHEAATMCCANSRRVRKSSAVSI